MENKKINSDDVEIIRPTTLRKIHNGDTDEPAKDNPFFNTLKDTSLNNLNASLKVEKQIIKHTTDGIIVGFYIQSKHASLGLTKKLDSLYKAQKLIPTLQKQNNVVKKRENQFDNIFVKSGNKLVKINLDTILFAHTDSKNYCAIVTSNDKKFLVRYSVLKLKEKLDTIDFVQTHRSYIINWSKVDSLHDYDQTIEIKGHHIPMGRTFKDDVYKRLKVI